MTMLQNVRVNPEDRDYLRQSQCGGSIKNVLACCPKTEWKTISEERMSHLPDREMCGQQVSHSNLFGGKVVDVDEFPWVVQLWYLNSRSQFGVSYPVILLNTMYNCRQNPSGGIEVCRSID